MKFQLYTDVQVFYEDTVAVLMMHEAQNMILLGNLIIGREGKAKTGWQDPKNWLMATVTDEKGIRLTAVMTPPHAITLYATDNIIDPQAIQCLIQGIEGYEVPGVTTEKNLAMCFAQAYALQKGLATGVTMDQRIYGLTAVNQEVQQFGTLRLLNQGDMHFFPYWLEAFFAGNSYGKTVMSIPQEEEDYRARLSQNKLYVLEVNGRPVSMAGFTREMQHGIGVAYVYTPPYDRNKGYATSCVAQISQLALDKGFTNCVLYTDLTNPISNGIYQKIGYKAICDSLMLKFHGDPTHRP